MRQVAEPWKDGDRSLIVTNDALISDKDLLTVTLRENERNYLIDIYNGELKLKLQNDLEHNYKSSNTQIKLQNKFKHNYYS